jgi:hypothetical protein
MPLRGAVSAKRVPANRALAPTPGVTRRATRKPFRDRCPSRRPAALAIAMGYLIAATGASAGAGMGDHLRRRRGVPAVDLRNAHGPRIIPTTRPSLGGVNGRRVVLCRRRKVDRSSDTRRALTLLRKIPDPGKVKVWHTRVAQLEEERKKLLQFQQEGWERFISGK